MVYRNDDPNDPLNDGPNDDRGESGPEEPGADSEDTHVSDDTDDGRYGLFDYPGPSADDIARSERDAFDSGVDGRYLRWLKSAGAVLLLFVALGLLISLVGPLSFSRGGEVAENVFRAARVQRVVDGNTIVVEVNGRTETVRYIGISVGVPGESLHRSSRLANQSWVDGQVVILERDVRDRDTAGRLLRYVYVNNQMMNAILVNSGLARYFPDGSNIRYNRELLAAESAARDGKRGLWTDRDLANDRPA